MPTDDAELRARIQQSVVRFIARVVLYNQAVAQAVGLGGSDAQFLTLLQVHGPLTAGQLADMTGLTTGTTTGVIDRLERAGFARRERDPEDRRKVIITRDEAAIGERIMPYYASQAHHMSDVLARCSTAELSTIAGFLDAVLAQPEPPVH